MFFSFYFTYYLLEFVNGLYHASESENSVELEEIDMQMSKHIPNPPTVPVYTQINIAIPAMSCSSPQLDSLGSSPKSDYSSYSSSSGKQNHNNDSNREKIMADIRTLTPKLRNVNLSEKQSPRLNYMVHNVEAVCKPTGDIAKKVTSELFIPIHNHESSRNSDYNSYSDSTDYNGGSVTPNKGNLPDNLTFANQDLIYDNQKYNNGFSKDVNSNKNANNKSVFCTTCNTEIGR